MKNHKQEATQSSQTSQLTLIDLFCGAGGLSTGFEWAGFKTLVGVDRWDDALQTFAKNHPSASVLNADMLTLDPAAVESRFGIRVVDVIIGGPPCQGFSIAGKRIVDDVRNKLYKGFVRFVEHFRPRAFVMENVPNILSIGDGAVKRAIVDDFSKLGYQIDYAILNAADFGVPQARRRAFFIGLRHKSDFTLEHFEFPNPFVSPRVTIKDAISDLPEETLKDGAPYPHPPMTEFQRRMREGSSGVYNHFATIHTATTKRIIGMVPDGGNYLDLPKELQSTRKVHIAWTRFASDKPSFTIDTGHNHHFHYLFNRVPTVRESARIQSFPDSYIFQCGKTSQLKQVGNAVPPMLAYAVATKLKEYLK